jgi:hypothetical protein
MNIIVWGATWGYALIVRLYPRVFRAEFEDEMRAVFAAVAADATKGGRVALLGVLWRELRDCPRNLLVARWQEAHIGIKEANMLTGNSDTPGMLRGDESLFRGLAALLSKRAALKRAFDILIAGFFLAAVAPLCAVLAVLIKLDSPGPVIFQQRRVGRNGRPYTMYKFRSMLCGVDGMRAPVSGGRDPRITRAGRFIRRLYLDELPQLFNVLKGEMSVFGPCPELSQ